MADTKSGFEPFSPTGQFSKPVTEKPKRAKPKPAPTSAPSLNKQPFALIERFREDIQKAIGKLYTQGHVEAADVLRSLRKAIDTTLPEAKAEAEKRAEEEAA